jgi:hypothetical protein
MDTVGRTVMGFWTVAVLGLTYILAKLIIGMPWYYVPHPADSGPPIEVASPRLSSEQLDAQFPPDIPPGERYDDDPVTEDPEIH